MPEKGEHEGQDRIVLTAGTFCAKYRNGSGVVVEKATGCRDETAARSVLAELERRAELVKSKVLTAAEDAVSDHQDTALAEHIAAFGEHLTANRVSKTYHEDSLRYLRRLAAECPFSKLSDLDRSALERWLARRADEDMSARTCNAYRAAAVRFCNWCVKIRRLTANPFEGMPKLNERADRRRERRALTEAELVKLLEVARRRPLLDRMTVRRGVNKGKAIATLREVTRTRLERLGRERALIYKSLVLTGLRKKELASLTAGQLELDGPVAYAVLDAADEKNREGSDIALRADLAADLRPMAGRQARSPTERSSATWRADSGAAAGRYPSLLRAGRSGADSRPRFETRRHPQTGRTGPDRGRSRHAAHLRDSLEQGRGAVADRSSGNATQRPAAHGKRLHRPEVVGRSRGARRAAGFTARRGEAKETTGDRHSRPGRFACTAACTKS